MYMKQLAQCLAHGEASKFQALIFTAIILVDVQIVRCPFC